MRRFVWMTMLVGLVACGGGGEEKPAPEKKPEPAAAQPEKTPEPAPDPQEARARALAEKLDVAFDEVEQLFREGREPSQEPLVRVVGETGGPAWAGNSVEDAVNGAVPTWPLAERWLGGAPAKKFSFPAFRLEAGLYTEPASGATPPASGILLFRVVKDDEVEGQEGVYWLEWTGVFVPDSRIEELLKQ